MSQIAEDVRTANYPDCRYYNPQLYEAIKELLPNATEQEHQLMLILIVTICKECFTVIGSCSCANDD